MTAPVLLHLSPTVAGHLATAIRVHREWAARVGLRLPPELADMQESLTSAARQRQQTTELEDLFRLRDRPVVPPMLLTHEQTAAALGVSVRSVQRLVASGELRSVAIGGSARIRVADLTRYVDQLAPEAESA